MLVIQIHRVRRDLKRLVCHSGSPVFMRSGDRPAFTDLGHNIGHGLTPHAGDVAGDLGSRLHQEVAQGAGDGDVFRAERDADALLGVVVVVDGVVAPVGAVVVPEVVVWVGIFVRFHAPTRTQGVGHPLSQGRQIQRLLSDFPELPREGLDEFMTHRRLGAVCVWADYRHGRDSPVRTELRTTNPMNTQLTEIAFILDRSGSMQSQLDAAIKGFNDFLHTQCDVPGQARFTLVLFDDQYEVTCASVPICEVVDLDKATFTPRGMTALLDAIGRTIDELGGRLAAMPEPDRPGQVIVAILTDGLENASRKFSLDDVSQRIAHQRDVYKWQFFFLGADQDAIATAAAMNIDQASAMRFVSDDMGFRSSSAAISRKMRSLRKSSACAELTLQEEYDLKAPLSDIGRDEERRDKDS